MSSMLGTKVSTALNHTVSRSGHSTRLNCVGHRKLGFQPLTCRHATGHISRQQQTITRAASSDTEIGGAVREPEDARGAISIGLGLYEEGKYKEALEVFEKGLELPGTGMKRFRDKPRSISDGEKQSVLYNIACCHSRLEDARTGLVALAGCLEAGFDDAQQLQSDPDLAFLRKDSRFTGLIQRFKIQGNKGFLDDFLKGFNL